MAPGGTVSAGGLCEARELTARGPDHEVLFGHLRANVLMVPTLSVGLSVWNTEIALTTLRMIVGTSAIHTHMARPVVGTLTCLYSALSLEFFAFTKPSDKPY